MRTKDSILAELKELRGKLEQAVTCQKLAGSDGYRLLMAGVAEQVRSYGRRLMQMDCAHDETNQLRAKINALNWFMKWTPEAAATIQKLVKDMEGLQKMASFRHDPGAADQSAEIDQLVAEVQRFKSDLQLQE